MAWEDLLAHPALTFDPNAEVTALLLAPASDLPRRPWLYDATATTTASDPEPTARELLSQAHGSKYHDRCADCAPLAEPPRPADNDPTGEVE